MAENIRDRLRKAILRRPDRSDSDTAKSFREATVALVREVREEIAQSGESPDSNGKKMSGGFRVGEKRVLDSKPAASTRRHIMALPRGQYFPANELAYSLGVTEETLRKHARALGALKYVEHSDGNWIQSVMHPDTAQQFHIG